MRSGPSGSKWERSKTTTSGSYQWMRVEGLVTSTTRSGVVRSGPSGSKWERSKTTTSGSYHAVGLTHQS